MELKRRPRSEMVIFGRGCRVLCSGLVGMAILFGVRFGTGGLNFSLHIGKIIHLVPTVKAILFNL